MENIIYKITRKEHTCIRCNGLGWIPKYNQIKEGICFGCNGTGSYFTLVNEPTNRSEYFIGDKVTIREGEGIIQDLQKVKNGIAVAVELKKGRTIWLLACKEIVLIA